MTYKEVIQDDQNQTAKDESGINEVRGEGGTEAGGDAKDKTRNVPVHEEEMKQNNGGMARLTMKSKVAMEYNQKI